MQTLSRASIGSVVEAAPERILQIGEGKFIRAFVDWLVQALRQEGLFDGSVVLTPARASGKAKVEALAAQDGLFTVWTRGIEAGQQVDRFDVVSSIARVVNPFESWDDFLRCAEQASIDIVVSNTTELGIVYVPTPRPAASAPATFPARLAAYLARRFARFHGDPNAGMLILPTELIDDNGATLRDVVLRHAADWQLEPACIAWMREHNAFCDTLVDRIVPGMPDEPAAAYARLGYVDTQLVIAEPFYLWAIAADARAMHRLPFDRGSLHVYYTDDLAAYRIQKLRVLNGTHTFLAPLGLLLGCATVHEAMMHPVLGVLTRDLVAQVTIPYGELDAARLQSYAATVFERFLNPFIAHRLRDITLSALIKFRIRLLPVLQRYVAARGQPPEALSAGLAALLQLYRPEAEPRADDDSPPAALAREAWAGASAADAAVARILSDERIWQTDLTRLPSLLPQVCAYTARIQEGQLRAALAALLS